LQPSPLRNEDNPVSPQRKLPAHYAGLITPIILSLIKHCVMSLISAQRSTGFDSRVFELRPSSWLLSWLIAFPVLMVAAPLAHRIAAALVHPAAPR